MPTYKDMDVCLPFLRKRRDTARTKEERIAIAIAINLITELPQETVEEGVLCRDCWFYDAPHKKCTHDRGLIGRILPKMYCSFGSRSRTEVEEMPEPDFSEFDEDGDDE